MVFLPSTQQSPCNCILSFDACAANEMSRGIPFAQHRFLLICSPFLHLQVKEKPTVEQFISMNRGINNGGDLPRELLEVGAAVHCILCDGSMIFNRLFIYFYMLSSSRPLH